MMLVMHWVMVKYIFCYIKLLLFQNFMLTDLLSIIDILLEDKQANIKCYCIKTFKFVLHAWTQYGTETTIIARA